MAAKRSGISSFFTWRLRESCRSGGEVALQVGLFGRLLMRILMVAPSSTGLPELDVADEMDTLSGRHEVHVVTGDRVTVNRLYQIADRWRGDAIHYVSHMGPEGVLMAGGEYLTREDIASLCRITHAPILFLNGCDANELASHAVRHGADYALFSNVKIDNDEAMRFALRFYSAIKTPFALRDVGQAMAIADPGDGDYGWMISPELLNRFPLPVAGERYSFTNWRILLMFIMTLLAVLLSVVAASIH